MNVRAAAAEVIARVLRGQSLSALLPEYSDRVEEKDRPLLKEMCFGTMRWYPQIAILLKQLLAKPLREKDLEVQGLLACGLYQLMHMRIAEHAILNETVSATTKLNRRWAKGPGKRRAAQLSAAAPGTVGTAREQSGISGRSPKVAAQQDCGVLASRNCGANYCRK